MRSGTAATGYQNTATQLADQLRAVGKASTGVSSAITGAGKVVGQTQQVVTQLVDEAAGKINTIMTQAMATAQVTGGASIAAAIPQAVGVATDYGQQIAQKMGALLSSSQNLAALVLVVLRTGTHRFSALRRKVGGVVAEACDDRGHQCEFACRQQAALRGVIGRQGRKVDRTFGHMEVSRR